MLYTRILWTCVAVTACSIVWVVWAPNSKKADEARAVKSAMSSYVHAFATGDGTAACDQLTEEARLAVIGAAGRVGARSCPAAFEQTLNLGGAKVRNAARSIRVHKVHIKGSGARVTLKAADGDSVADLQKVDGQWKIASLPKA